jgi:hypothetical protein
MKKNENEAVQMPEIESKELKKFVVYKQVVMEYAIEVYAEDKYDANQMVENHCSIDEYMNYAQLEHDDTTYDNEGYVYHIDNIELSGTWFGDDNYELTTKTDDFATIYKFEDDDWSDSDKVFSEEDNLIDEWKTENETEEIED